MVWDNKLPFFYQLFPAMRDGRVVALMNLHPAARRNSKMDTPPTLNFETGAFTYAVALPKVRPSPPGRPHNLRSTTSDPSLHR